MANYYHKQGLTLDQVLESLYQKYGYHLEVTESFTMPGVEGNAKIKEIMAKLRAQPLTSIGGVKVKAFEDYLTSTQIKDGKPSKIELPVADVIRYVLESETIVAVRPSGTEPKIKFYYNGVGKSRTDCLAEIAKIKKDIKELIK